MITLTNITICVKLTRQARELLDDARRRGVPAEYVYSLYVSRSKRPRYRNLNFLVAYPRRAARRRKLHYDPSRRLPPHNVEMVYRPRMAGRWRLMKENWECVISGKRLIDGITFGWSFDRRQAYIQALRPWKNAND